MQLSRDAQPDVNIITGLDGRGLRVRERVFTASLVLSANAIIDDWPVRNPHALEASHWNGILELQPEIVLLGSGRRIVFPDARVLAPLLARNVGVEVMDTPAACRTYNLLLTEGRSVVAALILGDE